MFAALSQQLLQSRHRCLVVVSGDWSWCVMQLPPLDENCLWLGEQAQLPATAVSDKQAQLWLGRECSGLVINGFNGIDLNSLGALTGTIKAGGFCVLLCPPFNQWLKQNDPQAKRFTVYPEEDLPSSNRWLKHLINTVTNNDRCLLLQQNQSPSIPKLQSIAPQPYIHEHYKSEQQALAVSNIIKVATGHRRRPLVLTADRGRGKSSALGLAVCELFRAGKSDIVISAPKVTSTAAAFARVSEQFDVLEQTTTSIKTAQGHLRFIAPDELIRHKQQTELLLVDEAAAIPAPMLTNLLKRYSRVVFTSTIAGYEGTGRGFEVRFKKTLNQLTPDWQAQHMTTAIRFAADDPLEQWTNQVLLLDAQATQVSTTVTAEQTTFTHWDRDNLLEQPQALSQIMGLLMLSHYKTSPNDLRHLLDGSNMQLYTLASREQIIATALVAIEGGFDSQLSELIWQGNRRPKGHLLPQTLGYHSGFVEALSLKYARVVRIAVHPQLQQLGLGSHLLTHIFEHAKAQKIDFVGSCFGATSALLRFWQRNDFQNVRVGLTVEATSNEYSAVVLKPLSGSAKALLPQLKQTFDQQFAEMLNEHYRLMTSDTIIALLQQVCPQKLPVLSDKDKRDIHGYLHFNREYEFTAFALYRYTLRLIEQKRLTEISPAQQALIVDKVLRKQDWQQICQSHGYQGKKAAQNALKQSYQNLS